MPRGKRVKIESGMDVGKQLKKVREKMGLSLREVGRSLKTEYQTIANLEKGRTPNLYLVERLCKHYGLTMEQLRRIRV